MRLFQDCDDGTLIAGADHIQNSLIDLINHMDVAYICLDAVDECSLDTKRELLEFVYVVIGHCENIKIMISSRNGDYESSEFLDSCPSITITQRAVAGDIEKYVRHRIDQGPKRLKLARSDFMVDTLILGAEGMYGNRFL